MDAKTLSIFFLLLTPDFIKSWQTLDSRSSQEIRKQPINPYMHYHSKRHMLPRDNERKKRVTTSRSKEYRKQPTGYLRPLQEDDIENDEVVSVAIGPPLIRPKYEKLSRFTLKPANRTASVENNKATDLVKDVLVQLGREFVSHQVNEDFVFGQYVGNSMKNLTSELRLKMQHEILDLIVKYQKVNQGDAPSDKPQVKNSPEDNTLLPILKEIKNDKKIRNETEDWSDFSNLAKIVG